MLYLIKLLSKRPYTAFSTYGNSGKELTSIIMQARSTSYLHKVVEKNTGRFNLINIAALLKKVSKDFLGSQELNHLIYKEVRNQINQEQVINSHNARAIANIIGYTGNLNYSGINDLLQKIDYLQFFPLLTPKEFVMAFTGLVKLKIAQKCIQASFEEIVKDNVNNSYHLGLLISVWRSLVKNHHTTPGINQYLVGLISNKEVNNNIKDYGYLVFCFTEVFLKGQNMGEASEAVGKVQKMLKSFPQNILYTYRVNIYELCNIMDYIRMMAELTDSFNSENLIDLLLRHYMRLVGSNINLRSLANGYYSLLKLFPNPSPQLYHRTGDKFISLLESEKQSQKLDFQSITSLFNQLLSYSGHESESEDNFSSLPFTWKAMLNPILRITLDPTEGKVEKMEDKEFQKLIYGLSIAMRKDPSQEIPQHYKDIISKEIMRRNLNDLQIVSIVGFSPWINFGRPDLCSFFRKRISGLNGETVSAYKLGERLKSHCILNLKEECKCK